MQDIRHKTDKNQNKMQDLKQNLQKLGRRRVKTGKRGGRKDARTGRNVGDGRMGAAFPGATLKWKTGILWIFPLESQGFFEETMRFQKESRDSHHGEKGRKMQECAAQPCIFPAFAGAGGKGRVHGAM